MRTHSTVVAGVVGRGSGSRYFAVWIALVLSVGFMGGCWDGGGGAGDAGSAYLSDANSYVCGDTRCRNDEYCVLEIRHVADATTAETSAERNGRRERYYCTDVPSECDPNDSCDCHQLDYCEEGLTSCSGPGGVQLICSNP